MSADEILSKLDEIRTMSNPKLAELLRDKDMMSWTQLLHEANNEALARIIEGKSASYRPNEFDGNL